MNAPGHVFDEPGLAAAGRALEQHRKPGFPGGFKDLDLIGDGQIPGLGLQAAGPGECLVARMIGAGMRGRGAHGPILAIGVSGLPA